MSSGMEGEGIVDIKIIWCQTHCYCPASLGSVLEKSWSKFICFSQGEGTITISPGHMNHWGLVLRRVTAENTWQISEEKNQALFSAA